MSKSVVPCNVAASGSGHGHSSSLRTRDFRCSYIGFKVAGQRPGSFCFTNDGRAAPSRVHLGVAVSQRVHPSEIRAVFWWGAQRLPKRSCACLTPKEPSASPCQCSFSHMTIVQNPLRLYFVAVLWAYRAASVCAYQRVLSCTVIHSMTIFN